MSDLDFVDPKAINTVKYAADPDIKRRKQAEILIPERLSLSYAYDVICFSLAARLRLLEIFDKYDKKMQICVSPGNWYFRTPQKGTS